MKDDKETREEITRLDEVGYLVLKMQDTVEVYGIQTKLNNDDSLMGFSPIYRDEADAMDAACDGKYPIIAVKVGDQDK